MTAEEARWNEERKAWARKAAVMAEEMRVLKEDIEELRVHAEGKRLPTASSMSNGTARFEESSNAKPNNVAQEVSGSPSVIVKSHGSDEISEEESLLEMDSVGSVTSTSIDLVIDSSREWREQTFKFRRDL